MNGVDLVYVTAAIDRAMGELQRLKEYLAGDLSTPDPVAPVLADMRSRCSEVGHVISWDGRVGETAAADLLSLQPQTLRNRRVSKQPPEWRKANGRITYALQDLAQHLVDGQQE